MTIPDDETRLQRPEQRWSRTPDDIATSTSSSGWLASASLREIRLYNVREANRSRKIPFETVLSIQHDEDIRAIALSEDLLVVLTRSRLLVYDEYRTSQHLANNPVHDKTIDQKSFKTSWSVSVLQTGTVAMGGGAMASIAVAGVGENGVKVFRYSYRTGWQVETDRMILKCPGNIGAIKTVGFSPFQSNSIYGPMVYALTANNHLYCWRVGGVPQTGLQMVTPSWHINCNSTKNQYSFLNEISSAAMIIGPTGKPYILCTTDHQNDSHLLTSFIVPVDILEKDPVILRNQMRALPDSVVGSNVLAGVASPSGRFLVIVEKGDKKEILKVLNVRNARDGGLTCTVRAQGESKLRAVSPQVSAISISIEEQQGALEIIAVDGRSHVVFARVSAPDMPTSPPSSPLSLRRTSTYEFPSGTVLRELSSDASTQRSTSSATMDQILEGSGAAER
ncbi:hypothetical protein BKA66DRAFT_422629 [Pyrenochaeta sp. MPI-SDFR-AT-0127]|nr:hypothetical protein BKA66DRAFT_422629 [Pyrenochaeta sp. MPI-SDFR-AT-0127]